MTGAEIPLIIAMIGSTGLSAYSAIQQGNQKAAMLEHQAKQKDIQAQHTTDVAAANSRTAEFNQRKIAMAQTQEQHRLDRRNLQTRATALNKGLSADVMNSLSIDEDETSALALSEYSQRAYDVYSNNVNQVYTAGVEVGRLKEGAALDVFGAGQARATGMLNAAGEVASGAVSLYSTNLNYKTSTGNSLFGK